MLNLFHLCLILNVFIANFFKLGITSHVCCSAGRTKDNEPQIFQLWSVNMLVFASSK